MLPATRRLLTETLHPLERQALLDFVSFRGGAEDAEALLPALLAGAAWDHIDPVARHGGAAMVAPLYDVFVRDGRLVDGAHPALLTAFGWAGLDQAREMLFEHAAEANWDTAPAAVDGLVHLSPDGLEGRVRDAVSTCLGRTLFPEYLPALAGWIGDAALIDDFIPADNRLTASPDCLAGVILALGLLGSAGQGRLDRLFWTDNFPWISGDQPYATGIAMRACGLGVADLAQELRRRLADTDKPEHWWFGIVESMAGHQLKWRTQPQRWLFLPPPEPLPALLDALYGSGYEEDLGHIAFDLLPDQRWIANRFAELRERLEAMIRYEAWIEAGGACPSELARDCRRSG